MVAFDWFDRSVDWSIGSIDSIDSIFEETKEMKMPILFDTREQAEKEAYTFGCEGAHQMGNKWMPCSMHKHNH